MFWTSGQRHIERGSTTPVLGGVRWRFRLYSPNASPDSVSVRFLIGNADAESPGPTYATLDDPSHGTLSAGDTQIDGLDAADNGATVFEVTWLAPIDGFSIGNFAKITPEVFS